MTDYSLKQRISLARKTKKWTQKDLADALKVNLKNVSRWELGSSAPSFEAAIQLADVLEVSLDYLGGRDISSHSELVALLNTKASKLSIQQSLALKTILEAF